MEVMEHETDPLLENLSLDEKLLNMDISMESNITAVSSSNSESTTSTIPAFHSSSSSSGSSSGSDFVISEWLRADGDVSIELLGNLINACIDIDFSVENTPQLEAIEAKLEMEKKVRKMK